jgi:O-antigen ligase
MALPLTLAVPLGMMHAYVVAEAGIALVGVAFLARSALRGEWTWARTPWVRIAALWWGWLALCSLPGIGYGGVPSFVQAVLVLRYLVFAAALEHWVLVSPGARLWLQRVIAVCVAWIAAHALFQAAAGRSLFGAPRWFNGELTGPFDKPRAGAPLSRMLLPAMLPAVAALLRRRSPAATLGAAALTTGGLAVVVLIGQRMPLLLTVLGLAVCALFLRRLRAVALAAVIAGGVLLAASAVVSPPTFNRLVTRFSAQMENFSTSPYGQIAGRAAEMVRQHPWVGRGYNGFRTGCDGPRYLNGWLWPAGLDAEGCNLHPHNHYLQAATDAGLPGLALFSLLVLAWLAALMRGLWQTPDPLRVSLFAAALIAQWPLASTSSMFAIEIGGLFFVLLGLGLAAARHRQACITGPRPRPSPSRGPSPPAPSAPAPRR